MTASDNSIKLLKKIHEGMDDSCFTSILTDWKQSKLTEESAAQDLFDLMCSGLSAEDAGASLDLDHEKTQSLIHEYKARYCNNYENTFYDRLFNPAKFYQQVMELISTKQSDAYFSINSFYNTKRKNENVRHINAFILDFDFYKISKYESMDAKDFYHQVLKKKLCFQPTGVIDSGKGLYIVYAFKHCSYHMDRLYHAVWKHFYNEFEKYGMDPAAMLTTQVIRIPGTINSKTNKVVNVLEFNNTDYEIQDFATLLPWSQDQVKEYRKDKLFKLKIPKKKEHKDYSKRKIYFKPYYEDLKKLIRIRNKNNKNDGYRERLLYICRERACWMGFTIDESVKLAHHLNEMFNLPLTEREVEKNCKPSDNRLACSIDTIIDKLGITYDEQLQLKVLKRRYIKKSLYAKHKRKHPLLNLTDKQQMLMERRAMVCKLKNIDHLKNSEIADKLETDKSTITRDLQYIKTHPHQFIRKLKDYLNQLEMYKTTDIYKRTEMYKRQKQLLKWLKSGYTALDYLVRVIGVAKN